MVLKWWSVQIFLCEETPSLYCMHLFTKTAYCSQDRLTHLHWWRRQNYTIIPELYYSHLKIGERPLAFYNCKIDRKHNFYLSEIIFICFLADSLHSNQKMPTVLHSIYVSVRQMCEHMGFTVGKEDDPNWCVSFFINFLPIFVG